ncbi:MAG TPA: serine hydrolase [Gemmataceae bacterium]|nr:serine hydrolase [Gemmataceae bacterium]
MNGLEGHDVKRATMMGRCATAGLVCLMLCRSGLCGEQSLEDRLAPLAQAHKGKVAVAVKNLETGESWYLNADELMPTASLIKVAVLIEAYEQADEGKVKLTDSVTLHDADKVPGSGVLTDHFSDGATFPLRDAVRLMIAFSDNTATNLVLDRVGVAAVDKRMEAWGFFNTKINAKVFRGSTTSVDPARTKQFGLGSTTAREMVGLFEEIAVGDRLRPPLKQAILGHLKKNQDKDKFISLLPPDTVVAHKDGAVNNARTDAGLIYTPGGVVAVCVLTTGNEDQRWRPDNAGNVLCARVAKEVYDHFAAQAPK